MDLNKTWENYQARPYKISEKQQTLITKLAAKIKNKPLVTEEAVFTELSVYLKRHITGFQQLTSTEVSKVIYILKCQQVPTKADLKIVVEKYSLDSINEILAKTQHKQTVISSYDNLNHGQVQVILGYKKRFKSTYQDHPLIANVDYEYGWQESPLCCNQQMYYLKFYELMMLDYDEITYDQVLQILTPYADDEYFSIHQTFNGYHVFVMSRLLNHRDPQSSEFMIKLQCDHYYVMFCHVNGYKIRLSPKEGRNENYISREIANFGNPAKVNSDCQKLLEIFQHYLKLE